jgi:hypothetical protein
MRVPDGPAALTPLIRGSLPVRKITLAGPLWFIDVHRACLKEELEI